MSTEQSPLLDQLEAEFLREARQELEPDQTRIDGLWRSLGAAGALGAAVSGVSASVAPASGTAWAPPEPLAAPISPAPTVPSTPPSAVAPTSTLAPPAPALAQGAAAFGLRALFGAAMGGALLGFIAGYGSAGLGGERSVQRMSAPPAVPTLASTPSKLGDARPNGDTTAPRAAVELDSLPPSEARAPAVGPAPKSPAHRVDAPPAAGELPEAPAEPSFYEELQYLKRAQSALRQGNGALALGLMTTLDSIQPGGALLSERGVAKVLAHCQLGDVESAQRIAEGLATQGMASVYAERLEHSCAGAVFSKQ